MATMLQNMTQLQGYQSPEVRPQPTTQPKEAAEREGDDVGLIVILCSPVARIACTYLCTLVEMQGVEIGNCKSFRSMGAH